MLMTIIPGAAAGVVANTSSAARGSSDALRDERLRPAPAARSARASEKGIGREIPARRTNRASWTRPRAAATLEIRRFHAPHARRAPESPLLHRQVIGMLLETR